MKFRVMVGGKNVLVSDEARETFAVSAPSIGVLGFVTTRFVTASSNEEACSLAIDSARQELLALIANNPSNPPTFEIIEVVELKDSDPGDGPRRGFTFYSEPKIS